MRLFTVPANFLAAPIAMVAYPHFAREAARPDHGELRTELARTLRYVFFIFLPVTVWFVLNALPITRVLFERGSFTLTDSQQVAHILWVYGIGILPNAITLVVLRACYALQDTVSPLIAECINLAIYSVLSVYLTHQFGITGLASARTVAFFVVLAALLVAVIRHKESLAPGFAAVMFAVRVGIASAVAGFAIWLITMKWTAHSAAVSRITDIAVLLTTGSVGFVVYLVCARILGLSETTVLLHSARDFVMRLRPRG
jgi:putative peptidoglycan lipid II flippase